MKMQEITREQFEGYPIPRPPFYAKGLLKFYRNVEETMLGLVLEDPVDHDYSFVVMEKTKNGFVAIDVEVSFESIDKAIMAMHQAVKEYDAPTFS